MWNNNEIHSGITISLSVVTQEDKNLLLRTIHHLTLPLYLKIVQVLLELESRGGGGHFLLMGQGYQISCVLGTEDPSVYNAQGTGAEICCITNVLAYKQNNTSVTWGR